MDDLVDGGAKVQRGIQALTDRELDALEEFNKAHKQLTPKQQSQCLNVLVFDEKCDCFKMLRDGLIRLAKHWGYLNPRGDWA